jgi:hypothetical protein
MGTLTPLALSSPETFAAYIVVYWASYWLVRDAHIADAFEACWTVVLTPYFSSSAEVLDAHITAHAWVQADRLREAVERLEREDADVLEADQVARLNVTPTVVRPMLWMLQNDLYRLADSLNDGWDEIQRAKAEADTLVAFAEKSENMSLAVKRSQQNRKRQAEREAQRAELDALIRAEVDPATAAVRSEYPNAPVQQDRVNYKIADNLERRGENGGKRIGKRRIEQARKGR